VIDDCASRLQRLEEQLHAIVPNWSMASVVAAYQAMRDVSFVVAVTFVAEIGDVRRFENPRQLMTFLGLVSSERSTGDNVRRAGLTLAGNRRARRARALGHTGIRLVSARSSKSAWREFRNRFVTLPGRPRLACVVGFAGLQRLARRNRSSFATAREMAAFL
jgi:transposase